MFKSVSPAYSPPSGAAYAVDSRDLLKHLPDESVDLVLTSPPFALQRQKAYGNKDQADYLDWLMDFARLVHAKLKPTGSFVVDVGGAYQKGVPTRSLYHLRLPIRFCDEIGIFLAEDFYGHNPSKLPSPIERSEERRVGKGGVSQCKTRWSPYH